MTRGETARRIAAYSVQAQHMPSTPHPGCLPPPHPLETVKGKARVPEEGHPAGHPQTRTATAPRCPSECGTTYCSLCANGGRRSSVHPCREGMLQGPPGWDEVPSSISPWTEVLSHLLRHSHHRTLVCICLRKSCCSLHSHTR